MSPNEIAAIWTEVNEELEGIQTLSEEVSDYEGRTSEEPDPMQLRAIGSVLHDFYSGIERIFELIAKNVDEDLPSGEDWHNRLLVRMGGDIEGVRPAVLSDETRDGLEEYLRFRHLFRNIYGYKLRWERMEYLLEQMPEVLANLQKDLEEFKKFMSGMKDGMEREGGAKDSQKNE